jgi:hypothetical protein
MASQRVKALRPGRRPIRLRREPVGGPALKGEAGAVSPGERTLGRRMKLSEEKKK